MKTNNRILLTAAILSVISAGANAENIITLENNHTSGSNYNLVSTVGNVKVDTEVPKNENTVHNVILGGWSKYTGTNIYNIFSGTEVAPSGRNVENIAIGDVVKIKDSSYGLMIGNHITNENDEESIKKYGNRSTMIKGDYITVKNSPHATVMGQHNNVTNSYGALVHGKDIVAENARWSIVMGEGASAKLAQAGKGASVVIGPKANTNNYFTVSLGVHASTTAYAATAIGGASTANGKYSLAMAQGTANGYGAIAIGMNSKTDNDYAVAIGKKAKATGVGSMALGDDSVADRLAGTVGYLAEGKDDATWKSTKSALSVGDRENNVTRQLTGLAAGTEDTDAVNVAQLKVVEAEAKKHSSVIAGDNTTVTTGTNAAGGVEYKVAVNKDLNEMNSVNFGKATDDVRSTVTKDGARFFNGSENIGVTSNGIQIENTDTLDQAKFDKTGMYASEGNKTVYYTTAGISAGDQIINNVKAGVADTDAVNVAQLNGLRKDVEDLADAQNQVNTAVENTLANHKTAINNAMTEAKKHTTVVAGDNVAVSEGTNAAGGKEYTVSVKKDLTDMNSVAFGKNTDPKHAVVTKDGLIAFDGDVDTKHDANGVTIENRNTLDTASYGIDGMTASGANGTVSFTTTNVDVAGNQIHNVATGTAGTDAVNVDQLNSVVAANKAVESVVADNQVDNIAAVRVTNGKSTGDANAQYGVYVSKNTVRNIAKDAVTFKGDDVIKVTRQVNENGADVVTTTYNGGNAAKVTPLTYKANGGAANTTTLNTGLDFTNGNNTTASVAANGVVKFDLNKDLKGLDSAKFNGGVVINNDGINAGNKTITNVAAGQNGTDAVNVNQLTSAIDQVNSNASKLGNVVRANQEEARKGIAGTAALAGLHPLDFDPDHKLDIMAGYGHFHNANAGAVGIAYRPNEDLMFTAGTTFGSDNVINAGVTYKVGARSEVSRSKVAMAKDLAEAKKEIAQLQSDNAKFKAILNAVLGLDLPQEANTVFPDIEENHWAYVAVEDMAKRGLLVGYPDGTFKGDRAVTRYEFAEVIHRAIEKAKELGQTVDSRLVEEFKPELMRYAVEGKKLERVHVNKSTKEVKRDQYGTIITK